MRKILLLLFIIIVGFSINDVRVEFILLDWQKVDGWKFQDENGIGFTFKNAVYSGGGNRLPCFARSYPLSGKNQRFQFVIEDAVFKEPETLIEYPFMDEIPENLKVEHNTFKSGGSYTLEIQIPAVIRKNNKIFLLKEFKLKQIPVQLKSSPMEFSSSHNWKNESVLKNGKWYKISTRGKGIYKIPYSVLNEWGFSNPSGVKVFGGGGTVLSENPGETDYDDLPELTGWHGKNKGADCLLFFAPGTNKWELDESGDFFEHTQNHYSEKGFFFLTEDGGSGRNVETYPPIDEEATHSISAFDAYDLFEKDKYNLLYSGKQWFSEKFIHGTTKNFHFELPFADNSGEVSVLVKAVARSSAVSEMPVSVNQNTIGKLSFLRVNTSDATALYAHQRKSRFSYSGPDTDAFDLTLDYFGNGSGAEAWLDYIEINYRRKLKVENEVLFFRDKSAFGNENILEFIIESGSSDLKVWDVSDVFNVKEVPVHANGNKVTGKLVVDKFHELAAFDPDGTFPEPKLVGEVENQNLHAMETPEYLIISHPVFLGAANKLADFHRNSSGLHVEVVSSEKVYNEFSSGSKSATGIRNFIKMFYDRDEGLKYILLFGDGSYDNKNINKGNSGFIPTFQSDNSLNPVASFITDDYFVILDEGESVYNGAVDLGIGRIPASTVYQADLVVNKIRNYHSAEALGNWRNIVCFIADDEDGNLHMSDSERLATKVNDEHDAFITDKIYFDAYQQVTGPGGESYPEVTDAINERVKEGVLVLNYVGHANERFLADEKVLDISHINSWPNANRLPIFVTATCEFSRFDADDTSAGEYVLFNPNGGGIGLFSTTRLVFAYSNYLLSRSFYNFVFEKDENGKNYRMGDIMRLAKVNTINTTNKRNFSLLADPALRLSVPRNKIITSSVNGKDIAYGPDTLGALQHVTITGFIADESGNKLENFSGKIISTVFDKPVHMKTLGNSGENPMEFKVQENIIYRGETEVEYGEFSFRFVIPKDISYRLGTGKIIYYADNGETDAHGAFDNFYIGGSGSQIVDNQGPEIELFIDTYEFEPGDKVSKNPILLAKLFDENGINTVGTGIGHDITAVIDDDYSNVLVLNNYYRANPGEHKSGTISFPLKNIPVGKHTLRLKAWDVANNSTEKEIEFEVTGDFIISEVTNYPNPVTGYTFFTFEHNQSGATFDTFFEVFDQNGRRIDSFSTEVGSGGSVSNPVRWDLNERKSVLSSGVYIIKVTAQNNDGVIASHSGKMIIGR